MAASGFLHTSQSYRSALPPQSPFALNVSTSHFLNREPPRPVNTFFTSSPPFSAVRVLIRRLPLNTSEESLRLMVVWSNELVDVELLPVEQSEDRGFRCAILRFRSMAGALEAKKMLDGRSNISNDAEMAVEILATAPARTFNHNNMTSANPPGRTPSAGPSRPPPQRFSNSAYHPLDRVSPTSNSGGFAGHELPNPDTGSGSRYQNLFSPQSPIGNHLAEPGFRMSGKTLISSDFGDDDETRDILNDPVAYAENGATSQRRATAPQILPVNHMGGLSLTTSNPPAPSSLAPYIHPMSPVNGIPPVSAMAPVNTMAPVNAIAPNAIPPTNATGPSLGYTGAGAGAGAGAGQPAYGRHSFPPVNPADQNPPCNTLYVGNLPIDTSEEELKAMFSKQRGYKRLCFRTKSNGPMCFVEFEDVSFATKALHELYGQPLHNSVKGGIRLSFSKNPLGVRSGQTPTQAPQGGMPAGMNGMMPGLPNGFASASGPPPGLTAPPGLGAGRINYNTNGVNTGVNAGMNAGASHRPPPVSGFAGQGHPWNVPVYQNGSAGPHNGGVNGNPNNVSRMMGR